MRKCMKTIQELLKAKVDCIWINTFEEREAIADLRQLVKNKPGTKLLAWSHTEGLQRLTLNKNEKPFQPDPKVRIENIFKEIRKAQENTSKDESIWILKDLHLYNDTHQVKRSIRDLKEKKSKNYNPIIVISPVTSIPLEHQKLFTIVDYDLPSKEYIRQYIDLLIKEKLIPDKEKGKNVVIPTEKEINVLVNACSGLTFEEIKIATRKSLVRSNKLDAKLLMEEKIQLVKKSGVLDYIDPKIKFEDIGGNHIFKEWFEEMEQLFSPEAKEFGCEKPKGYLSLGVPGTAKSAFAEAIASKMRLPLIKFNMSKIMSRFVGESEQRIAQAFQIVETCAPCILFIDEVEKALAGNFLPS